MNEVQKTRAVGICRKHRATVEFHPVITGKVYQEYLGMTYACPAVINELVKEGFSLSLHEGHIIIDNYNRGEKE